VRYRASELEGIKVVIQRGRERGWEENQRKEKEYNRIG
jgi:hypothetical protein